MKKTGPAISAGPVLLIINHVCHLMRRIHPVKTLIYEQIDKSFGNKSLRSILLF